MKTRLTIYILSLIVLLSFNASSGIQPKGWPEHMAMGTFSIDPAGTDKMQDTITKYGNIIDIICQYSEGQADWVGDKLYIKFPKPVFNTVNFAYMQKYNMIPLLLIYTANGSQDIGTMIRDFKEDNMAIHFTNLILDCQLMRDLQGKYPTTPEPSIIINPDLLSEIQKQLFVNSKGQDKNTWTAENVNTYMATTLGSELKVKNALKKAIYFTKIKQKWVDSTGKVSELSPSDIVMATVLSSIGKTTPINWAQTEKFKNQMTEEFSKLVASDYSKEIIPDEITDNFTGYIQAVNYIVKEMSADDKGIPATFGWAANNWSVMYGTNQQGMQWIHTISEPEKIKGFSEQISKTWKNWGVYSGKWPGDYIAFDKYERNSFCQEKVEDKVVLDVLKNGWLWNNEEWLNYLNFIGNISNSTGKPILLFQIPGGHLSKTVTNRNIMSTEPQFFLGDTNFDTTNVKNDPDMKLNTANYGEKKGKMSVNEFLFDNTSESSWYHGHMKEAADANVIGIIWGGGNTTGIGEYPKSPRDYTDGGWLAEHIKKFSPPVFVNKALGAKQ